MLRVSKLLIYLLMVIAVSVPAVADWIPIRIVVDDINIGDLATQLNKKDQATGVNGPELINLLSNYIQPDKITRIKNLIESDDTLSLENLARVGITSKYNEKELRLTLGIPLEIRAVKDFPVLMTRNKTGLALYNKNYSGYFNIRGLVGYSDSSAPTFYNYQKAPIEGQLELVQNLNYFTFESTGNYKEFDSKPFQRNDSALVHDFESEQIRLKLGDYFTGVQGFQSALAAGGVQIQKQFNIFLDKGSINKRSTNIQIKNNSLMEVFVNKNLILRTRVNAGPYNLKELPLLYGRNKIKVILTDDFGGKEEFEVDLLFDDQILAKGVNDFSYQVGKPSTFVANEKTYVKDNFSSFFHKYGLTDETTIFINHQNYLSSNLFGVGVGVLTDYGTNFIDVAQYSDSIFTSASAARWHYNSPELSLNYFDRFRVFGGAEFRSAGFSTITATATAQPIFSEKYDFILQKQLTDTSSMSLGITKQKGQNFGVDDLNRRFVYQNQFASNWRFDFSYSWSEQQKDLDQILLTLNWLEPEGKAQAAFAHDTVDNNTSVRVTKNNKLNYNDLQLNIYAAKQKPRSTGVESQDVDLSANYYATKYEARLQITGSSNSGNFNTFGQLGFGSALAWTTDGFSFSRPIPDAFAIVEAEGLGPKQHLTIPNGLERDSIIIENGQNFVFSNLTSYVDKPLRLDSTSLGASGHLDREAYLLNPKYRSGLFVPLKVIKALSVRGRLAAATKAHVSYLYGKILTADGKVFSNNFFTDESGKFVIDGLSYGKYQIVLSDTTLKKINFELKSSSEAEQEKADAKTEDPEDSEYELGTIKIEKEK